MRILNIGCGTKASAHPDVVNIDWSIYLRIRRNRLLRALAPLWLRGERLNRLRSLPDNILVHDLSRGIPFGPDSVDVVYHSHFLEHLDRDVAERFLLEVKRVLKPGGVQRIVVPDLERLCRELLSHISVCEADPEEAEKHESYIAAVIEQCVRTEGYGTRQQPPLKRLLERFLLGDARRRGETHRWMYDRISLSAILRRLGYRDPQVKAYDVSSIPNWDQYGLDRDQEGKEYKPGSLYMEALK